MPEALTMPCAAAESRMARGSRYAAGASLAFFALAQCAMACMMVTAQRGTPQTLYLVCACAMFAAVVIAVRERRRALIAVRVLAVATAVMLFWSISGNKTPSVNLGGRLHDLTPLFAGMLLCTVLLPRLLRERDSDAACNCQ